jgi:hypothetical protein
MVDYLLSSLHADRARKQPHPLLTLAVSGWVRYLRGTDLRGEPVDIEDTRYDRLPPFPRQEPATRRTCSDAETSSATSQTTQTSSPRSPTWSPASRLRACTQQSGIYYRSRSSREHYGRSAQTTSMVRPMASFDHAMVRQ